MKNKILLVLLTSLALGACHKETIDTPVPSIPQLTEQERIEPVSGTTVTQNNIVYTQLDKELGYNKFITVDVDQNGKNDFYFTSVLIYDGQSHLFLMASPVSSSGAKLLLNSTEELVMNGMWAKDLVANTPIDGSQAPATLWSNFMIKGVVLDQIDHGGGVNTLHGPWVGKTDRYLGMQIVINGVVHYGWIHFAHTAGEAKLRIVGIAYHEIAGQMIRAGQMR